MKSTVNISGRLRNRLFSLLVIPILFVSIIFTIETFLKTQSIAKQSFDDSLTILTLAIMGQSENFHGNSLPEDTLDLINTANGAVFYYYIVAPEGGFVSGYSNPPKPSADQELQKALLSKPYLFNGTYQDIPVRAASFRQFTDNPDYTGWIELTVWQNFDKQYHFQHTLFNRSISRLFVLVSLLSLALWFGIHYGLKPLEKLQNSVKKRSINDLSSIKSPVPYEIKSLVESMNDLFHRLQVAIKRREAFLGNASHQLKTPLARIRSQSEVALRAKNSHDQRENIQAVIQLTEHTSRLTNQMLSLLRAESSELLLRDQKRLELNELTKNVAEHYALDITRAKRELVFEKHHSDIFILGLPIMLSEAIGNLVENAMHYSTPKKNITIRIVKKDYTAEVWIIDNGPGININHREDAVRRFYRVPGTKATGCGLGLAIVNEIIKSFNGELLFDGPRENHFAIGIKLPIENRLLTT